jgi:hypothetical protein
MVRERRPVDQGWRGAWRMTGGASRDVPSVLELEEKARQGSVSTRLSCGKERGGFNGLINTTLRQRRRIRSL